METIYRRNRSGQIHGQKGGGGGSGGKGGGNGNGNGQGGGNTVAAAVTIYNGIKASARGGYWEFDDNSGASSLFSDSSGNGNTLQSVKSSANSFTANNTTTTTPVPKQGRCFGNIDSANSRQWAIIPRSNTNLDLRNVDQTFWFWTYGTPIGGTTLGLCGRRSNAAFNLICYWNQGTSQIALTASSDGTSFSSSVLSTSTWVSATWYLIACTLDRTNNLIRLRLKNTSGSVDENKSTAFASALYTGAFTGNFCFNDWCYNDTTAFDASYRGWNGTGGYDLGGFGEFALSDAGFSYLWNSGAGRTWASLASDAGH